MSGQGITEIDLDGDGTNDAVAIDSDGDGNAETVVTHDPSGGLDVMTDTDGDGVLDTATLDTDGDGNADTVSSDSDGDGVFDTTSTDTDGDGVIDVVEFDADGDGHTDLIQIAGHTLTLDPAGHVVTVTDDPTTTDPTQTDPTQTDPSTTDATTDPTTTDPSTTDPTTTDPSPTDTTTTDPSPTDTTTTDPSTADPDAAERADDAGNWFEQSENGFCAPASVAMIVAEYSDQSIPDETAFVQRAVDLGYLTYDQAGGTGWSGITIDQTASLLESFGVEASVEHGSVDSLDGLLDRGYNAIVSIDSSEVWYGTATGHADHAVVVSSIENGMVYLEDPGTPDGRLEPVPVDVFEKAWSASNDEMVVTDNPDTGSTPTPGVGPDVYDAPTSDTLSAGTVLLPITLSGDDVAAWHALHG